jgi:hypothetical protein
VLKIELTADDFHRMTPRVRAALDSLGVKPRPVQAAATPAAPKVESHEAFIRRLFPVVADQLGYAAPFVGGFLMGSSTSRSVTAAAAPSGQTRAADDDRAHRELMASHFPTVAASGGGASTRRRARIRSFS